MNGYSLATDPGRHQRASVTRQGFTAGLRRQVVGGARDINQWSIRDHLTNSEIDRGQHISAPQIEHQLSPLQQGYRPDFSEPQRWSVYQDYNPHVQQSHPQKDDNAGIYLPGQGRNKGIADHQMLRHLRPRQDFSHVRYESREMQDKLAVVPRREINGHLPQSQSAHNSAPFEDDKHHIPQRSSNNRNGFQENMNRTFIAQESTQVLLTGGAKKIYPWQLMYEVSRPGQRSDRIVKTYIPKAVDETDVSSLLRGGGVQTLPPERATDFKENLVNGRPRYQQLMPDYSQGYPSQYICEPPQPDYASGSTTNDHIQRFPLGDIHERTKPAKSHGSTAQGYMQDLSSGYADTPQPSDDYRIRTPSFSPSPRETENISRVLVQTAGVPAWLTPGSGGSDFRTSDDNSNYYAGTSTRRNDSLMLVRDQVLPTLRGRFQGFNEARLSDNNSNTFRDAGDNDINVYVTATSHGSFSPAGNTPNNRWRTSVGRSNSNEQADVSDVEVTFALNQLDDATTSESEMDVSRELEYIFQTEGEILY